MEELSRHWDRLLGEIGRLDHKIDTVGIALSSRIDALDQKFDRRFEAWWTEKWTISARSYRSSSNP